MTSSHLRVCYVVGYFHPYESGAERQALEQGRTLVQQGHLVHVVTRAVPGLARDEVIDGISVHRWVDVNERGPMFAISFVTGVIRALRRLRAQIDIVHTHQALWEAVATGLGRGALRGVPTLIQPASAGYFGEAQELARTKGRSVLRQLILRNSAFAAISSEIADEWRALGAPTARIVRTVSGVDAQRYSPGQSDWEERLPPRPRILFTGRLHPQKNLGVLLDSWPEILAQQPAHLILAGDGSERLAITDRIERAGLTPYIHLLGTVHDIPELLRAADIFALPSVAEGMSNSLLEAMATGLACVASDIGGNRDLIGAGLGRLVAPNTAKAWTDAILGELNDHEGRHARGARARAVIESDYALPVVVERYVNLYRRIIGRQAIQSASPV